MKLTPNNAINRDIDTRRVTRSIAQQVHVGAAQLLHLGQARHAAVVLELLVPVGLLGHPVGHGRVDEARRHRVDADAVLGPLHGQRVRHVAHSGLGGAVGGGGDALWRSQSGGVWRGKGDEGDYLVGTVGGHGCGEDDGTLDAELDEGTGGYSGAVEGSEKLLLRALVMVSLAREISHVPILPCFSITNHL